MDTRQRLVSTGDDYLAYCFANKTPAHVNELAQRFHLLQDQFSRLFKKLVGQPPDRYLNTRQIERAKDLLRTTDLPIAAIAAASGFGTTTTFHRAFLRITGMTPGEYRRRHKT